MTELRTDCAIRRERRDRLIYEEFRTLMAAPGASVTKVTGYVAGKYGVCTSTVYNIRMRAGKREGGER